MSAGPRDSRVGWCPSVATPMAAHDGLLVRIKPTAATIPAVAARAIAEASIRFGNGEIDLTNRANLQIRGLRTDTADAFAKAMREVGLASADGAFEEIRNVTADPLGRDDPEARFDSHAIARAVEVMLAGDEALRALPPKFGFLVDCGHSLPVPDGRADIVIRADGNRLTVAPDGGTRGVPCSEADAPVLAGRLARAFLALAGPPDAAPYRMRELVQAIGEDAIFAEAGFTSDDLEMPQPSSWAPDQVRGVNLSYGRDDTSSTDYVPGSTRDPEAAGNRPTADSPHDPSPPSSPGLTPGSPGARAAGKIANPRVKPGDDASEYAKASPREAHLALMYAAPPVDSPLGWVPFAGRNTGAVVAGLPRGRLRSEMLGALAGLAETHADGTLRMTPWRAVAFVPVAADRASALIAALASLDLITDPADPRRALRGHDFQPMDIRTHRKAALP